MQKLEHRIIKFIKKHHVFTLATFSNNNTWCSSCFYAFNSETAELIFTSDDNTTHIKHIQENNNVAGNIVLETKIVGQIQGIQITGKVEKPEGDDYKKYRKKYLLRFPYAVIVNTSMWVFKINTIKMTDNRLGFGKKLYWER